MINTDNVVDKVGNADKIIITLINELLDNLRQLEDMAKKVREANEFLQKYAKRKREYSVVGYFIERYQEV